MTAIKEKAVTMLQNCKVVVLTSINAEGYPRPVPMLKIEAESFTTVWMATGYDSFKAKDFLSNSKAGVCFYNDDDNVALTGNIEIITDVEQKQEYWKDWLIGYFPKGVTDPNCVFLKFEANYATMFIDNEMSRIEIK